MTVVIECISWLIKVIDNNDARWKPEIPPKYLDSILASLFVKLTKKEPLLQDHSFIGCDVMQFGR
jgi:hypothetical protein